MSELREENDEIREERANERLGKLVEAAGVKVYYR